MDKQLTQHAIFAALLTCVLVITYYVSWFLYGYLKIYDSASSEAYMQLVIGSLIAVALVCTVIYGKFIAQPTTPTQITEPNYPQQTLSKVEKQKQENYKQLVKAHPELQKPNSVEVIDYTQQRQQQTQEVIQKIKETDPFNSGTEPDWNPNIEWPTNPKPQQPQTQKTEPTDEQKLKQIGKQKIYKATVDQIAKRIASGEIKVNVQKLTELGLDGIEVAIAQNFEVPKPKQPAEPPQTTEPPQTNQPQKLHKPRP